MNKWDDLGVFPYFLETPIYQAISPGSCGDFSPNMSVKLSNPMDPMALESGPQDGSGERNVYIGEISP